MAERCCRIARGFRSMTTLLKFSFITITWQHSSSFVIRNQTPSRPSTRSSDDVSRQASTYWRHYQASPSLQRDFERSGGILYRTSVLSSEEYAEIHQEVVSMSGILSEEITSSVAKKRIGAPLSTTSKAYQILENGSLKQLVHRVSGKEYELAADIPVEVRVYERVGAGMEWHVDDVLYDPPQLEVVYTLENTSDCVTMWRESSDQLKSMETDANSVLMLRAGGVSHCVSSLKRGRRVILKCAFVTKGAENVEQHAQQFISKKAKSQRRKKR